MPAGILQNPMLDCDGCDYLALAGTGNSHCVRRNLDDSINLILRAILSDFGQLEVL